MTKADLWQCIAGLFMCGAFGMLTVGLTMMLLGVPGK